MRLAPQDTISHNETRPEPGRKSGTFSGVRQGDLSQVNSDKGVVTTWDAIPSEQVRPGVSRRAVGTKDAICVLNRIEPEMEPAPHVHEDFDQFAFILSGRAVYYLGETGHEVGPGAVMLIPAGVRHWIEPVGDEPVDNLDVFAPARTDYLHLLDWMATEAPRAQGPDAAPPAGT
jgi:mannose-6-phosphate isomerase-like protein (cupin superfamily)